MRLVYLLALIIFIGGGCRGGKQQGRISNDKAAMIRVFDIHRFSENKNEFNEYSFRLNDSITVRQQETTESFYEFIVNEGSDFEEVCEYYKTGDLKSSFMYFRYDFPTGIYKEYDKQGKLIKEEDLDKGFTFSWKDVKQYLKAHGVKSIKEQMANINRTSDENPTWILEFEGSYKEEYNGGRFVITLDGITGEEIEVKQLKGKTSLGETGTIANYEIIYSREGE